MTIITISRGSYSKGSEIAQKVASKLGFECVGRDLVLEATERFHIPEIKLVRAIHDAPTILDRFGFQKEKYTAYVQAAFLTHMKNANVVYHGLAGHFFLTGVSHVLKVRIISDMEDRVQAEMERENIKRADAERILKEDDEERRKWSRHLYNIDPWDPSLYDLVIHIRKITTEEAAEIITDTAQRPHFKATAESERAMEDLVLAAEVKVKVIDDFPSARVTAKDGDVYVKTRGHISQEHVITQEIEKLSKDVEGVKKIFVELGRDESTALS